MALLTSILTAGTNNHQTTAEAGNRFTTDFVTPGVVGSVTNTSGVAPMTGAFAVNAAGTPNKTVIISTGDIVIATTPSGQGLQNLITRNTSAITHTVPDNTSGSTRYDFIYAVNSATNANNPNVAGDNVTTIVGNRSTSSGSDSVGAPANSQLLAVVTLTNGFVSITNSQITDARTVAGAAVPDGSITSAKIASGGVGAEDLSTSAITLGHAQSTTAQGSISVLADLTGLTTTVTVPTGGRRVKITLMLNYSNATAGALASFYIREGATTIKNGQFATVNTTNVGTNTLIAVITPSAGSHTYKASMSFSAGTGTAYADTSGFINELLVEAI